MMFLRPNCRSKDSQETPPLVEYAPAYSLNKLYEKNPQRLSVIRRWVKGTYLWITCKLPRRPKTIVYCIVFLNSHGLPELSSLRDPAFFLFLAAPLGCEYKSRKSRARFPQWFRISLRHVGFSFFESLENSAAQNGVFWKLKLISKKELASGNRALCCVKENLSNLPNWTASSCYEFEILTWIFATNAPRAYF